MRVAPVPFSVVCLQWAPATRLGGLTDAERCHAADSLNSTLLDAVNRSGEVLLSHPKLYDRFVIRLAIGHERTTIEHMTRPWTMFQEHAERIARD